MKAKTSFQLSELLKIKNSEVEGIFTGVAERYQYTEDNKKTNILEAVVISAVTRELGEIQIVFPPKAGLAGKIEENYDFAFPIKISDFGDLEDVKISIYNNGLVFKFFMA